MVSCAAFGCNSRSERKEPRITFHRFPKKIERRSAWLKNMKVPDFSPKSNERLCSKHFDKKCFYRVDPKTRLLDDAIPTILPDPSNYSQPSKVQDFTQRFTELDDSKCEDSIKQISSDNLVHYEENGDIKTPSMGIYIKTEIDTDSYLDERTESEDKEIHSGQRVEVGDVYNAVQIKSEVKLEESSYSCFTGVEDPPTIKEEVVWLKSIKTENDEEDPGDSENFGENPLDKYIEARQRVETENVETEKMHQCPRCDYKSKWKSATVRHYHLKHDGKTELLRCSYCSFSSKDRAYFSTHVKVKHDENTEVLECSQCSYVTKRANDLKKHIDGKHLKKFSCGICGSHLCSKSNLKAHFVAKHYESNEMLHCRSCCYFTNRKYNMVRHQKIKHGSKEVLPCVTVISTQN